MPPKNAAQEWVEYSNQTDTKGQPNCGDLFARLSKFRSGSKNGPAWSPVRIQGDRADANVTAITSAVFDVDGAAPAQMAQTIALIEAAGIASLIHSTHSHRVARPSLRLVSTVSRVVLPHELPAVRGAIIARFQIPADPATGDLSRIYFLPTRPGDGGKPLLLVQNGVPLDVDALLVGAVLPSGTRAVAKTGCEWATMLESIGSGARNSTLASVAGMLFRAHPPELAFHMLHIVNEARCHPPLSEAEVSAIALSIAKKEARCGR